MDTKTPTNSKALWSRCWGATREENRAHLPPLMEAYCIHTQMYVEKPAEQTTFKGITVTITLTW